MTDSLERIGKLFQEFRDKVSQCREKDNSNMADIQDAYSRLYRLRERYSHETVPLTPPKEQPFARCLKMIRLSRE
jgi:hypothetical protein